MKELMKNRCLRRVLVGVALLSSACAGGGQIDTGQAQVKVSVVEGATVPEPVTTEPPGAEDPEDGMDEATDGDTTATTATSEDDTENEASAAVPADSTDAPPPVECADGSSSTYEPEAPTTPEPLEINQATNGEIERFTVDNWKINLCAGQLVFFDSLEGCSGAETLEWRLYTPDGEDSENLGRLINSLGDCDGDSGPHEILQSGEYTLEVGYRGAGDETGTYAMQVLNVPPPDTFEVAIGTTIAPGSPEGAGSIEAVGAADHYLLTLDAGQRIFFDVDSACSGPGVLNWDMIDPEGDSESVGRMINSLDQCTDDPDPITVEKAGTYTIRLSYGNDKDTFGGSYGFTIVDASGG